MRLGMQLQKSIVKEGFMTRLRYAVCVLPEDAAHAPTQLTQVRKSIDNLIHVLHGRTASRSIPRMSLYEYHRTCLAGRHSIIVWSFAKYLALGSMPLRGLHDLLKLFVFSYLRYGCSREMVCSEVVCKSPNRVQPR